MNVLISVYHFEKSEEHNEEGRKIDEVLKEEGIELEKRLK